MWRSAKCARKKFEIKVNLHRLRRFISFGQLRQAYLCLDICLFLLFLLMLICFYSLKLGENC